VKNNIEEFLNEDENYSDDFLEERMKINSLVGENISDVLGEDWERDLDEGVSDEFMEYLDE